MQKKILSKKAYTQTQTIIIAIVLIIAAGVVVWYISKPAPTPEPNGETNGDEIEKYWFTVAHEYSPRILDPHNYAVGVCLTVSSQVIDNLVRNEWESRENKVYVIKPWLATSWELVDDTTWRFHLREGVKFHDNSAFNASVVKFNFDRLLNPDIITTSSYIVDTILKSVEVEDEYTVLFHTIAPVPNMLTTLANEAVGICSQQALEKYGVDGVYFSTHPVGTGAFKFVNWVSEDYIKLEANDEWWGLDEGFGPIGIKGVIFKLIPDAETKHLAFLAKELDAFTDVPPEVSPALTADPDITFDSFPAFRVLWLGLNDKNPPLDDIRVRRAIAHAINRPDIIEYITRPGNALLANSPTGPPTFGHLPDDYYGPEGLYPYNVTKSMELLADAGWVDTDGDGWLDKDGKPFKTDLISGFGRLLKDKEIAEAIGNYLREIGIDCEVNIMEPATSFKFITSHDYRMYLLSFGFGSDPEPVWSWVYYMGEQDAPAWSDISNSTLDAITEEARYEMDIDKRRELYIEAQKIILEWGGFIPIYYKVNLYAYHNYVNNWDVADDPYHLWETWLEEH